MILMPIRWSSIKRYARGCVRKYKEESFFGIEILSEKPVGIFSGEEDKIKLCKKYKKNAKE